MKPLTKPERIALLEEWLEDYKSIQSVIDAIEALFGKDCEGRVQVKLMEMFECYSWLVSEKVGDNDEWLCWFIWENDGGKKALEAKAQSWKKPRKIRTVKDLEAIISAK